MDKLSEADWQELSTSLPCELKRDVELVKLVFASLKIESNSNDANQERVIYEKAIDILVALKSVISELMSSAKQSGIEANGDGILHIPIDELSLYMTLKYSPNAAPEIARKLQIDSIDKEIQTDKNVLESLITNIPSQLLIEYTKLKSELGHIVNTDLLEDGYVEKAFGVSFSR